MKAREVYDASDGEITKAYYAELQQRGPRGLVAMNLFRAQKCSARAKKYRGGIRGKGSYRSMAYQRKSWSMGLLCDVLEHHGEELRIRWGWQRDDGTVHAGEPMWVLYVDLPFVVNVAGDVDRYQVSFHSPDRFNGPDYFGKWDGLHLSEPRILAYCDQVYFTNENQKALFG